jgi:hypothetical protein
MKITISTLKSSQRALAVCTLAALLSACASKPPMTVQCELPKNARPAPEGVALVSQEYGVAISPIPVNAVLFTEQKLAQNVAVQALFSERTDGDTVRVTARLVSCYDETRIVRARVSFMKKNTAPAESPSAWQNVTLAPRATGLYAETSLTTKEVASYLIEISPLN